MREREREKLKACSCKFWKYTWYRWHISNNKHAMSKWFRGF